jgi:hypothetical protein
VYLFLILMQAIRHRLKNTQIKKLDVVSRHKTDSYFATDLLSALRLDFTLLAAGADTVADTGFLTAAFLALLLFSAAAAASRVLMNSSTTAVSSNGT